MAVATRTDAGLVRGLQARDRTAWEALYAEYQPRLRGFAYRLAGNVHDADDLVQETFVRALPALDRLDPETVDLAAYLFATTKNLFLKQVERGRRAEPTADVPEPDVPAAIEDDPERSALLRRQQQEVRVANARLDPRQRLVLALCELEDRSYAEIGELVGLNENAVAQLVFRARERLRSELRLVQVDPESLPEACRAFLPALAQHLDGRLRGPKLEATLAHLEGCERCQAALADMREAKRRYRALLLPPLGVSEEEARAAVDDELEHAGYWRVSAGRRGVRLSRRASAAGVAAVTAVLCVGGGLGAARLLADTADPARVVASSSPPGTGAATGTLSTAASTTTPTATSTAASTTGLPAAKPAQKPTPKPSPAAPAPPPTTAPEPSAASTAEPPTTPAKPGKPAKPAKPAAEKTSPPPSPPPAKDTTAPSVSIASGPPPSTSETSASFAFSASEPGATFACRLDNDPWEPCASPHAVAALVVGTHTLAVRATDRAGNVGTPAERVWAVTAPPDTTAPTVTFTVVPPPSSTSRAARFEFSAGEPSVTFACSYDGDAFAPCQSPHTIADAGADDHSLAVRATDAAGNTGPPAVARWTVVAPLPDLVVALTSTSVTVRNVGEGPAGASIVVVSAVGTFTVPALGPGESSTRTYACKSGTITASADSTQLVAEADEGNNTGTRVVSCLGFGT